MVIEGTQTGEERLIDITAARETEPIKETVPRDFSRYRKTAEGGKRVCLLFIIITHSLRIKI